MDHVAIMRKSWGLISKILDGSKKIESRWGINKCAPWGKIKVGDRVYFKNSGEKVTVMAKVSGIMEFENLNPTLIRELLEKYGGKDGIASKNIDSTFEWARNKRYCTLVYLKDAKKITPFDIDKRGFGTGAAWVCVENIKKIKKS